ncbi:uncharacterized protein EI90DRAFT_2908566 [Cantharellus anzutake]|uniref:uncharacterized protein n=1 Tax=Cantharellus anzutake TaxID=1750568 RepID=UPI001903B5F1|nr:uncharacterized protein EI90DRAFT_2908566 [Cantharellus anzutake]KAF8339098.1 hypothetical protein EI90DRAFT_2908566 [Cantharellus anzutake]
MIPSRRISAGSFVHPPALPETHAGRDTIFALATPPGRGGIGVIRVSGPHALDAWKRVVRRVGKGRGDGKEYGNECVRAGEMVRCEVVHPRTGEVLDDGMAVFFHAPHSYTSLPTFELHTHSGSALITSILRALSTLPRLRPAEPGEFTLWAFKHGKMDLTQAEAVRDLIDAETEIQRKVARWGVEGAVKKRYEKLRKDIIGCLALVEALIDFGEGEDIEEGVYDVARAKALELRDTIARYLSDNRGGEIIRRGIRLAIFGPPNAGKSSLLNFLAQRQAAIVTPLPGTTRDVLEISLDIGGMPVIAFDTAGLRSGAETEDVIERIGIQRASEVIESADVKLCLLSLPDLLSFSSSVTLDSQAMVGDRSPSTRIPPDVAAHIDNNTLILINKRDLAPSFPLSFSSPTTPTQPYLPSGLTANMNINPGRVWTASVLNNDGVDAFLSDMVEVLKERFGFAKGEDPGVTPFSTTSTGGGESDTLLITHERHRKHLENALAHLESFLAFGPNDIVLGAEELRYASREIGRISGVIDVEDILDSIFQDFCIGK